GHSGTRRACRGSTSARRRRSPVPASTACAATTPHERRSDDRRGPPSRGNHPPRAGRQREGRPGTPPPRTDRPKTTPAPLPLPPRVAAFHVGARAFAGAARGRAGSVTFSAGPSRVVQGNPATFSVSVSPAGARCSLSVRYRSGARQKGLKTLTAASGSATWTWTVPRNAQPGLTHDTASCAGAG